MREWERKQAGREVERREGKDEKILDEGSLINEVSEGVGRQPLNA
jgi:hypothetical protein